MKRITLFVILLVITLSFPGFAQSPFLDTGFGVNGRVAFSIHPGTESRVLMTAIQSDGKIIACASADIPGQGSFRPVIFRLNQNGSLDSSFATNGMWISMDTAIIRSGMILVQPDDKILFGGYSTPSFKLVRLTADGSLDNSFGTNGTVTLSVWSDYSEKYVQDMKMLPDGRILVSGSRLLVDGPVTMVARLLPSGARDLSFGNFGLVIIPHIMFNLNSISFSKLEILPDNSILVGGNGFDFSLHQVFVLLKYKENGQLDPAFGLSGIAKLSNAGGWLAGMYLRPDGTIYLLSDKGGTLTQTALYKLTPQGSLDTAFANNGVSIMPYNNLASSPNAGYLQSDGKVVVFGGNTNGIGFLGRYNPDGSIDTGFGNNGTIGAESLHEYLLPGVVQPDGKIVVPSHYETVNYLNICSVLRYMESTSVGTIETANPVSAPLIYPNPVKGQSLSIAYVLPADSPVQITLLDLQGKTLGTLLEGERVPGKHEETISLPAGLPSGAYLLNIQTNKGNSVLRILR